MGPRSYAWWPGFDAAVGCRLVGAVGVMAYLDVWKPSGVELVPLEAGAVPAALATCRSHTIRPCPTWALE